MLTALRGAPLGEEANSLYLGGLLWHREYVNGRRAQRDEDFGGRVYLVSSYLHDIPEDGRDILVTLSRMFNVRKYEAIIC